MNDSLFNPGLFALPALQRLNKKDNDYFSSLPEEIQEHINTHEDEIYSEDDLHEYAEMLMKKR
jgi:hypothetical protein